MKLNPAFEETELVLNELNEQFESINKTGSRIPQIEIDIIKATIRKLYERVSDLDRQNQLSQVQKTVKTVSESAKADIKIETEIKVNDSLPDELHTEVIEPIAERTSNSHTELPPEDIAIDFREDIDIPDESKLPRKEKPQINIAQTKTEQPKEQYRTTDLKLQFEDELFSVNESMAKKGEDKSVVNKLSNKRIENLKSAIGINDKFYFINELFSGNSQAYEDVIYTLNNFKRFEDAMQYFSTLKYRYEWNTDTEAYKKLIHFLERKFAETAI